MSGGPIGYPARSIEEIASSIDELIASNEDKETNLLGQKYGNFYPTDVTAKFDETRKTLRLASAMARRVDWLVNNYEGVEAFRDRWAKEVEPLKEEAKNV